MNPNSHNTYLLIHIVFLLSIFYMSVIFGIGDAYKIGKEAQDGFRVIRNKNGVAIIKMEWAFIVVRSSLLILPCFMLGAIALLIQEGLYKFSNWILETSIHSRLGYYEEWYVALFYGLLMTCGYYSGKAWASYFAAEQILKCVNKRNPLQHPEYDLTILKALEENMQAEEFLSNRRKP